MVSYLKLEKILCSYTYNGFMYFVLFQMSSGSESDEEFVPGEPEQLSEEDSADEETNLQYEKELEHKTKKRKSTEETMATKKRHTRNGVKEIELEQVEEKEEVSGKPLDPVEEKKREEDLWAMFLEGTDTKPKPAAKETNSSEPVKPTAVADTSQEKPLTKHTTDKKSEDDKARERRIFEFAGETIVVENNVIKERIKTADSPAAGNSFRLFTATRNFTSNL